MLGSPGQPESGDAMMQDAAEQPAPLTIPHNSLAQLPSTTVSTNNVSQSRLTVTAAPGVDAAIVTSELSATLDPSTVSKLDKAGFSTREQAMTWLTGDGYAKSHAALLPLGVTDSSTVALLQPDQLKALKPVIRRKMCLILENLISDSDRLQMVFEQHQSWLEENLGMEVAGECSQCTG